MQHPLAGILQAEGIRDSTVPEEQTTIAVGGSASRRSFLNRALAAAAGIVGLGLAAGRRAAAQVPGGSRAPRTDTAPPPTIQHGDRRPTTLALGEEAGGYRPSPPPPSRPPRYTTYALGEEGAYRPWQPPRRPQPPWHRGPDRYRPAPVTTYALGEEAGGYWGW